MSKSRSVGVSLVIPAWNDSARLSKALSEYGPALQENFSTFEVIVVSDGEHQPTRSVIAEFKDLCISLLEFPSRLGKGGAVREGFKVAKLPYVGFVDADAPIPAADLINLVDRLEDADGVIASRALNDSRVTPQRPLRRRILSRGWNILVRAVLRLPYSDTQCGAKFFRRELLADSIDGIVVGDWAFDISLLDNLHARGARIVEAPVTWRSSDESKLDLPIEVLQMLLSLAGVRLMGSSLGKRIPSNWVSWMVTHPTRG